jgi:YCII-related domain
MAKFMLLYRGDATPPEKMTEEQRHEVRAQWTDWVEKHRTALADVGSPLGDSVGIGGDGADQKATSLGGYSIVEADSLEAAKGFTDGHPFLAGAGADFAVDIYEMLPSPV